MFCTKCGKDNGNGNKFCIECGEPLKASENPFQPVASPEDTLDVFAEEQVQASATEGSDNITTILGDTTKIILTRQDGEEFKIESFPTVIGKGSAADLIIPGDESVSRKHFCIHESKDVGFVIEELGATNKTYLNGDILDSDELVVINNGDVIKAGKTELTVLILD